LVNTFHGFTQNSSEERQAATVLATFQKNFAKIWEMYEPIGRKILQFKTE
jgi:hypothetical protein